MNRTSLHSIDSVVSIAFRLQKSAGSGNEPNPTRLIGREFSDRLSAHGRVGETCLTVVRIDILQGLK